MTEKKPKSVKPPKFLAIPIDDPSLHPDAQTLQKGFHCQGCDLFCKKRFVGQGASGHVDIMLVSESPSSWSVNNQKAFYGRGGRVIHKVWKDLCELDERGNGALKIRHMSRWETYAVQCQVEERHDQSATANATTVTRCAQYLRAAILNKEPRIILAFGATALKALGYKVGAFMEARGRLLEIEIEGKMRKILPTFSTKHLLAKTGLYNLFYADFIRAVRIASGVDEASTNVTLEEITKEYVIPQTVDQVKEVCDQIISYVVEGAKTADQCVIAVDTETNTLNPHHKDAKVLCVSFAWDTGKATAISLFHHEAPWSPDELEIVIGHVRRVLECPKPKVFHNCLTEGAQVTMADGTQQRLGVLVRTKSQAKVLCVNEQTGALEACPITNWLRGDLRPWAEWRRIEVRGKGILQLTEDHEVLTRRGRVRADQLRVGDRIVTQCPTFTKAQRALIFGSLLGDASIIMSAADRSPHFSVSHAIAQRAYIDFKSQVLGSLVKKITVNKRHYGGFSGPRGSQLVTLRTQSDRRLLEAFNVTQAGTRKITDAWLKSLTPAALAIWYADDGCLQSENSASICVTGFERAGADRLVMYLRRHGWPARIDVRADKQLYLKIIGPLGRGMSPKLQAWWRTIAPYVPMCMAYKLPLRYRANAGHGWNALMAPTTNTYADEVTAVGPLLRDSKTPRSKRYAGPSAHGRTRLRQWCIEVEGNHNFFANGLAVSNCKFDLKFLELRHGWRVNNVAWDSLLGEHLLREDMTGSYGLKTLGRSYFPAFGNYADKVQEVAAQNTLEEEEAQTLIAHTRKGKPKKGVLGIEEGMTFDLSKKDIETYLYGTKEEQKKRRWDAGYERVQLSLLLTYAAVDTDLTRRLLRHQFGRMQQEHFHIAARSLMATHCVPASRALGKMEFDGFRVDSDYIEKLIVELTKIVEAKRATLDAAWDPREAAKGHVFNPNATQDIGHVLFCYGVYNEAAGRRITYDDPWIECNKKSNKKKTDKKTLKAIAEHYKCPFSTCLLEYRAAHKALTGFVKDIRNLSEYDGYLHTNFHLHGTSTGRTSSSGINMQNTPKKLAGVNIKKIFIPDDPEEEVVFNVDWKGAEIRVFTAYAPDEHLIKALNDGLDVHSWFTQEIFGIPYADVERLKDIDDEMHKTRVTVKRVVFGILYGAMAKKIAETANISEEAAQKVIDKLFDRFPSLRNYMDEVVSQIHARGYVETLFGRRRRFPLQNANGFFRGQAERRGKNMKIQSTSSDIVIGQLVEIFEHIGELGGRLCITVHDSIVGTIKKKYLHKAQAFFDYYCVTRVREKYPWLPVDFAHDISVGPNYGETIPLTDYLCKNVPQPLTSEQEFLELINQDTMVELTEDETEMDQEASSLFAPVVEEVVQTP